MFGTVAIRIFCATLAAMAILAVATTTAQAGVDISTKPTQNMSCSAGVCSPMAKKAVLNVNDVTTMLAAGDLKVTTGSGAEDIHIDAPFSWTSASRLTLDAQRSIEFKKSVTVAGTGALTLATNDGGTGGDYWFDPGASVTFWDTNSSLTINGLNFTLVNSISMLVNSKHRHVGRFALANNYDASADGTYTRSPIWFVFSGIFEGLGNKISTLIIKNQASTSVALFATLDGGQIRDLLLDDANIDAGAAQFAAILVSVNDFAVLRHCYVNGVLSNTGSPDGAYDSAVGGLVGYNTGLIANSHASSGISSSFYAEAGGLVGANNGQITQSSSQGSLNNTGDSSSRIYVGGLVGVDLGGIDFSSSTSKITMNVGEGGGLVGGSFGPIKNSHATGSVTATSSAVIGGLIGYTSARNALAIQDSYATGDVTGGDQSVAGGLAGHSGSIIDSSFATGNVKAGASSQIGGIVGSVFYDGFNDYGMLLHSYATGSVTGGDNSYVGGSVGYKEEHAGISQVYSVGTTRGGLNVVIGGMLGYDHLPHRKNDISASYWDLDTSEINDPSQGSGNIPNDPGITGLTDVQLKTALPTGFHRKVWRQNPTINNGYPYLLDNPPPK